MQSKTRVYHAKPYTTAYTCVHRLYACMCVHMHAYMHWTQAICIHALDTGYMHTCTGHRLYAYMHWTQAICIHALDTGYMHTCTGHRLYAYMHWTQAICIHALDTGYMHTCTGHRLYAYMHWTQAICIHVYNALAGYMESYPSFPQVVPAFQRQPPPYACHINLQDSIVKVCFQ